MPFSLDFTNNTILSSLFFFYLFIDLYLAVITQNFNTTVELVISIGIPTKETKAEMEPYQVIEEIAISE